VTLRNSDGFAKKYPSSKLNKDVKSQGVSISCPFQKACEFITILFSRLTIYAYLTRR